MKLTHAAILAAALAVSACASPPPTTYSYGNDFDESRVSAIVKGVTTTAEMAAQFGQPTMKLALNDREEKWIYSHTGGIAKAQISMLAVKSESVGTSKMLDVLVRDGVVMNYAFSTSATNYSIGNGRTTMTSSPK